MTFLERLDAGIAGVGRRFADLAADGAGVVRGAAGLLSRLPGPGQGVDWGALLGGRGAPGIDWGAGARPGGGIDWGAGPGGGGIPLAGTSDWGAGLAGGRGSLFGRYVGSTGAPFDLSGFDELNARQAAKARAQAAQDSGTTPGGGDYSGPATADDNATLTPAKIDAWIAGTRPGAPLAGMGATILRLANQYGVSAPLMLGIFLKESELGTTAGPNKVLAGITDPARDQGLGGQRAFQGYATWEDAIAATARLLASDTYKGKSLGDQVSLWYVGKPGAWADTDQAGNGTVAQYVAQVAQVYNALGVPVNTAQAPTRRGAATGDARDLNALGPDLAAKAQRVLGTPYTNAGIRQTGNPADGFDCSSFAGWLLGLPGNLWNAQVQYDNTDRVSADQARPGDLVFFQGTNPDDPSARPVSHVGVYLGNGMMVQTGGAGGVTVVSVYTDYWRAHLYGFGRVRRSAGGGGQLTP